MRTTLISAVFTAVFFAGCASDAPNVNDRTANSSNNSTALANSAPSAADTDYGLKTLKSQNDFEETYAKLKSAIENNEALKIIAEVDHRENAENAGLTLRPTRLIIFGNPKLGTPLMNEAQTLAIDLPQKMLIYETEAKEVFIVYNDPIYLAKRHSVSENREEFAKISNALKMLAEMAIGK